MMYQLRMYTINRGKMDEWVSSFGQTAVPQMTQYGITLEGAWANEDKTQFIWIRSFADQETLDKYYASPEFNARRGTASNVARVEFQNMSPAGRELSGQPRKVCQLRVYTVNRGMMDQWVAYFNETLVPMQEQYGMKIEGEWVSEDSTQFIWIRSFDSADDVTAKEAAFYGSPEWQAAVDYARGHLARTVVHTMEPVLSVPDMAVRS